MVYFYSAVYTPQQYRDDLLWFTQLFAKLSDKTIDRQKIHDEYWAKCFSIYDHVPMSVDERAETATNRLSMIFQEVP